MITEPIGMGKANIGKGTIGHIVQFVFPSSVSFHSSMWEETPVLIPKPAPGTTETLICIVLRVYGRENEVFIEGLGPGLILVYPIKMDMSLGCLQNNNIKGTARCTQLPITVIISMVVGLFYLMC
jgi:hypothetical protein